MTKADKLAHDTGYHKQINYERQGGDIEGIRRRIPYLQDIGMLLR